MYKYVCYLNKNHLQSIMFKKNILALVLSPDPEHVIMDVDPSQDPTLEE
jgi:hypothetical protein